MAESLQDRLTLIRAHMLRVMPFWGMLAWKLAVAETLLVSTAMTDGEVCYFNPKFAESLENWELEFVYAHEIAHCALLHVFRAAGRRQERWNRACDYALNPLLKDSGLRFPNRIKLLINPEWFGLSAERIYELLKDEPEQGGGDGFDNPNTHMGKPPGSGNLVDPAQYKARAEALEREWKGAVQQAAMAAKGRGKLPGSLERLIDATLKPVVDWRAELANFVQATIRQDYDWSIPNKRYLPHGVYMPAIRTRVLQLAVVVIDSSGSTFENLPRFASEVSSLLREVQARKVLIIWCDAAVQKVEDMNEVEEWKPKAVGLGGTSFKPPFEFLEKEGLTPDVLVYYTDMDGDFPDEEPPYPVLWASSTTKDEAPFGRVIHVNFDR